MDQVKTKPDSLLAHKEVRAAGETEAGERLESLERET